MNYTIPMSGCYALTVEIVTVWLRVQCTGGTSVQLDVAGWLDLGEGATWEPVAQCYASVVYLRGEATSPQNVTIRTTPEMFATPFDRVLYGLAALLSLDRDQQAAAGERYTRESGRCWHCDTPLPQD